MTTIRLLSRLSRSRLLSTSSSTISSASTTSVCASRRLFSAGQYSQYEYPLATEPPIITKTNAAEAVSSESSTASSAASSSDSSSTTTSDSTKVRDPSDPFDDSGTLSALEVDSIRVLQKQHLPTALHGSTPIGLKVPDFIPPNVDSDSLETPCTQSTTLANGIRVVSQETYGQVCSIGILGDFGSRQESTPGVAQLLELMAFQSTTTFSDSVEIQKKLQDWGGTSFANAGREQTLWCLDILRPNVQQGMELLKQVALKPQLQEWEVEDAKQAMQYIAMEQMPELQLGEALQMAAYGPNQQLGKPHFAPLDAVAPLTASSVRDFLETNLWKNPKGVVIAGAGISHEELVDMSNYHFGHLQQETSTTMERTIPSTYQGGHCTLATPTTDGMTRVGVALEVGGWHSDDLVPGCVLQTLLGGGNSFSAGGPGKGMYSRLYRQVLNRYAWAESAEAFTAFHNESGLIGISGSSIPEKSRDATRVLCEHLLKLAADPVSDEELDRAVNMLKNNVLTQLESRLVLFEDMGRQVLTFGHREDNAVMTAKIDAVTKEDLQQLILKAVHNGPPTLAAVGDSVDNVPQYEEVKSWFAFYE